MAEGEEERYPAILQLGSLCDEVKLMLRVLYPIHIDRWTNPIASLLREVACRNRECLFYSFSKPVSEEDRRLGRSFWANPRIYRLSVLELGTMRFDIVHHASPTPKNVAASYFARARSIGKCRHIFTANLELDPHDRFYWSYRASVRSAHVLIAVSHAVASRIEELFGRTANAIIPNGVDLDFFSPEAVGTVRKDGLLAGKPYVLFAGVVTARKRPDIFLRLASLMPELDFVMVGRPGSREGDERYLQSAFAQPNVKYLGERNRSEVRDLMGGALALVFPSEREGLPLSVVEASAMGLPVLAQPKSSLPEVVQPGLTGWLFPGGNPEVWVGKLRELLDWSDRERSDFGVTSRNFVAEHYSWNLIANRYREIYRDLS